MGTVLRRRNFLISGISLAAVSATLARAKDFTAEMPFTPGIEQVPDQVNPGPWKFFTAAEAEAIGALADVLIPEDELSPGGKNVGVPTYLDTQLAGAFGAASDLYMQPPFMNGTPEQGPQSPLTPRQLYRNALAALARYCTGTYAGKHFAELPGAEQVKLVTAMETGSLILPGANSKAFFQLLWQNTREGFYADPVYGGNRGMAGWKMVGFPGARYDYRDWISRHNEPYPHPPVGLRDHPNWAAS